MKKIRFLINHVPLSLSKKVARNDSNQATHRETL